MTDFLMALTEGDHVRDKTRSDYNSRIKQFIDWGGLLPTDERTVLQYIADRGDIRRENRLTAETLIAHCNAIKDWHVADKWDDPTAGHLIKKALRKLKSLERQNGIHKQAPRSLTVEEGMRTIALLIAMDDNPKALRDRLIFSNGMVSGHRREMISGTMFEHLRNLNEQGSSIIIETPPLKTNVATLTTIPFTGGLYCPATWMREYIDLMGFESGPIFRPMRGKSNKPLSGDQINTIAKTILKEAGIKGGNLSSGVFRKTMPTVAFLNGASPTEIAAQGGWESFETVNKHYLNKAMALLGSAPMAVVKSLSSALTVIEAN